MGQAHKLAQAIEVDDDDDEDQHGLDSASQTSGADGDGDGDFDGDDGLTTTSHAVFENGRRYCNDSYAMPNDEAEQTRLNILHQACLLLLDGELTKTPLPRHAPSRVLDIGTGAGDWALEMAKMYPDAQVTATDISVFDAGLAVLGLPNVHFQLDDAEAPWSFHGEPFDLVHLRGLAGALHYWPGVYRQAFDNLNVDGYIEVVEPEPSVVDDAAIVFPDMVSHSYFNVLCSAMQNLAPHSNTASTSSHLQPSLLTAAGFVDVRSYTITVPLGPWPRDPRQRTLGKMMLIAFLEGLEAQCLRPLVASGKWTASQVRDLCERVKVEVAASRGATVAVRFVTGRKPRN